MPEITLIDLLIIGLATWRLGRMFASTDEGGPFNLLEKFRELAGWEYDYYSKLVPTRGLSNMLGCIYCNTIWFGLGFLIFFLLSPEIATLVALPFAISGFALLVSGNR